MHKNLQVHIYVSCICNVWHIFLDFLKHLFNFQKHIFRNKFCEIILYLINEESLLVYRH